MPKRRNKHGLTGSLEDYLETILLLGRRQKTVRVKDIAAARGVRAPSVTLAVGKLAVLGLVDHDPGDNVALTAAGEAAAQRVLSRHELLTRFFGDILGMDTLAASEQACAVEHVLTDDAMDRLARFFEYLSGCGSSSVDFLRAYHRCPLVSSPGSGPGTCTAGDNAGRTADTCGSTHLPNLTDLDVGDGGTIIRIDATPEQRRMLFDAGLLPGTDLTLEQAGAGLVRVHLPAGANEVPLTPQQAATVRLTRLPRPDPEPEPGTSCRPVPKET